MEGIRFVSRLWLFAQLLRWPHMKCIKQSALFVSIYGLSGRVVSQRSTAVSTLRGEHPRSLASAQPRSMTTMFFCYVTHSIA